MNGNEQTHARKHTYIHTQFFTKIDNILEKKNFNLPHKAPFVRDSSLLSPQSLKELQIKLPWIHFPLLHWNSERPHDLFSKSKWKIDWYKKKRFLNIPESNCNNYPLEFLRLKQYLQSFWHYFSFKNITFKNIAKSTHITFFVWIITAISRTILGCLYSNKGRLV